MQSYTTSPARQESVASGKPDSSAGIPTKAPGTGGMGKQSGSHEYESGCSIKQGGPAVKGFTNGGYLNNKV